MNETLTTAQRQELKTRLLAVRKDLQDQMLSSHPDPGARADRMRDKAAGNK